ncbi:MFS general substrate transporter [Trichoderma ceciliae]
MTTQKDNADIIHLETHTNQGNSKNIPKDIDPVPKPNSGIPLIGRDKAAQFLKQGNQAAIIVTPSDNVLVLRKTDLRLLPIIFFVYCLQSLDKTTLSYASVTLSYASVFGLIDDTHRKGEQFSWLGTVVYIAQLVFRALMTYGLMKLPMGKLCTTIVFCSGAMLCLTFIAVVQMWYRRKEQITRNASWYAMFGVLENLLTYGLGHVKSTLRLYQIIFFFYGCITVAFRHFFIPDFPIEAKFLNEEEKFTAIERVSTFGPLIIQSFIFNSFMMIPFGAVQVISTLGGRALSDRAVVLVGYYIISVYPGISPIIYSWSGRHQAKSLFVVLAVLIVAGILWTKVLNTRRATRRRELSKLEVIRDLRMDRKKGGRDENIGDKAFEDITNLQNENFIYIY